MKYNKQQRKEFSDGYKTGYNHANRHIECKFQEGHSDFAIGYYGGYCQCLNDRNERNIVYVR